MGRWIRGFVVCVGARQRVEGPVLVSECCVPCVCFSALCRARKHERHREKERGRGRPGLWFRTSPKTRVCIACSALSPPLLMMLHTAVVHWPPHFGPPHSLSDKGMRSESSASQSNNASLPAVERGVGERYLVMCASSRSGWVSCHSSRFTDRQRGMLNKSVCDRLVAARVHERPMAAFENGAAVCVPAATHWHRQQALIISCLHVSGGDEGGLLLLHTAVDQRGTQQREQLFRCHQRSQQVGAKVSMLLGASRCPDDI